MFSMHNNQDMFKILKFIGSKKSITLTKFYVDQESLIISKGPAALKSYFF